MFLRAPARSTLDSDGLPLRRSGVLLDVGTFGPTALGVGRGIPVRRLLRDVGVDRADERFGWSPVARSLVWRRENGLLAVQKKHPDSLGFGLDSLRVRYHLSGVRWHGGTPRGRLQRSSPLLQPSNVVLVEVPDTSATT